MRGLSIQVVADRFAKLLVSKLATTIRLTGYPPTGLTVSSKDFRQLEKTVPLPRYATPEELYGKIGEELEDAANEFAGRIQAHASSDLEFVTIPLEQPMGIDDSALGSCGRVLTRAITAYDLHEDQMLLRIDVLYAFVRQKPEFVPKKA